MAIVGDVLNRRALVAVIGVAAPLFGGFACSLRDTSYLTSGGGADGGGQDVTTEPPPGDSSLSESGATKKAVVIATNQMNARLLAQDDDSLYWFAGGDLVGMKKRNETMPHMVVPNAGAAVALAADKAAGSGELFYAVGTTVFSVAKTGGMPKTVTTTSPPPDWIAVNDAQNVFVVANDPQGNDNPHIVRVPRAGGPPAFLESADTVEVSALALDTTSFFWDEGDNIFRSLPKDAVPDAGAPTTYPIPVGPNDVEGPTSPENFALDDNYFFYSDDIKLHSFGRTPGASPNVLITFATDTERTAIAIDSMFAYAIEESVKGTLLRNTKDGKGTAELWLDQLNKPSALVVDDTAVYLTVSGDGTVLRVDK